MSFINDDFLLQNKTARRLYHKYAAPQPILDYHNHLPPQDIATNRRFNNLFEIWLEGDHYKWRAMRANGVEEKYCTGDADPYDKFLAWAKTVPHTLRNPLYHWTHLELQRYFGIHDLLNEKTAPRIWEQANARLETPEFSTQGILAKFHVTALCTTDDPADDLTCHEIIAQSGLATKVFPAFRPDKALTVNNALAFNAWVDRLEGVSSTSVGNLPDFLEALDKRHAFFHAYGGRLSDHGLAYCYADFPSDADAATIFDRARTGRDVGADDHVKFASYLMLFFGRLDAQRGWTKQLHLGALRNVNTRGLERLGPDTGFDSIGDWPQAAALGAYLNRLQQEDALPKTIIYNNNPVDNYPFATMIGDFQDGSVAGKMQFGSGWWFLDTKEGIEWQINALSSVGLLSRFVGMLTDSRSFMSFPRHEYFRRVLCNMLGRDIENGEIPDDEGLVGPMIENICYGNARQYLGLEIPEGRTQMSSALFDLTGQSAVVLGGTGVLGGAMADALAGAGARVAVVGRSAERGTEAVRRIQSAGGEAVFQSADALDPDSLARARDAVASEWGPVAVLVNAAGGNRPDATLPAGGGVHRAAAGGLAGRVRPEPGRRRAAAVPGLRPRDA